MIYILVMHSTEGLFHKGLKLYPQIHKILQFLRLKHNIYIDALALEFGLSYTNPSKLSAVNALQNHIDGLGQYCGNSIANMLGVTADITVKCMIGNIQVYMYIILSFQKVGVSRGKSLGETSL